ncbi:MAG: hydantoinase/oxoprolinase family protein [Pseudomonadota bacterium]
MSFRIALDCGGTFTDGISVDERGKMVIAKALTTPKDLTLGVKNTLVSLAKKHRLGLGEFLDRTTLMVHGTTQGTNCLITRGGPKTGVITTEGYRDTLELRNIPKWNMYDWRMPPPEPLAPRYHRVEVIERLDRKGEVVKPLDEESVRKAVAYLKKEGVKAIAVVLLFSFLNSEHERRVKEIIKEMYPEALISLSSEVSPVIGEFDRTSTTVINAYISQSVSKYIESLKQWLKDEGFKGELLMMQSNGGVESAEIAAERPATIALSGPSTGPVAACIFGGLHGEQNLISVDQGGTTFLCGIVYKGVLPTKPETLIGDIKLALPVIDVSSIGGGGGAIAWLDVTNTLRVGPKSAAASPGPACYGMGGEEPTVTDSNVLLGYVSPDFFMGGEIPLRKDLAQKAVKVKIADKLGLSVMEGAIAIHKVINAAIADSVSRSLNERGYDPRDFTMCVGGSAGPVHACRIAQELGIPKVIITKLAPGYSAVGMLGVDLKHDYMRFYYTQRQALELKRVRKLYKDMESEANATLEREGVPEKMRILQRYMKLRYYGQFREVEVPWPAGPITEASINAGVAAFHVKHKELYGYSNEKYPLEFMYFNLTAIGKMPGFKFSEIGKGTKSGAKALKGEREVYWEESKGFAGTRVYDGDKLLCGNVLQGPCIVEEKMTTVVIPPGFQFTVDQYGNYVSKR